MYHNDQNLRSFIASGDMSGAPNRVVDQISNAEFKITFAGAGEGIGVLINKPKHGEHASVAISGEVQVRVGVAVQAGQAAMGAASGWVINVASTTVYKTLGKFRTGAASGMLATLELAPSAGKVATA